MASKIDFTGLNNFRQKLQKYSNFTDYTAKLISAIVDKGVEIAREEYAGVADVKIDYEKTPLGGKIIAIGDQIAYLEFGTGEYAKGTYEGKLPTKGVPITGKWTYYYDNPLYKCTVDGEKGWFTNKKSADGTLTFEIGQKAGNQMYRVYKQLREALPSIIGSIK